MLQNPEEEKNHYVISCFKITNMHWISIFDSFNRYGLKFSPLEMKLVILNKSFPPTNNPPPLEYISGLVIMKFGYNEKILSLPKISI
jgi:hypothetical protein